MTKKKQVNVIIKFDDKKTNYKEKFCDKLEFFLTLSKLKIESDYKNNQITENETNLKLKIADDCINLVKDLRNDKKF